MVNPTAEYPSENLDHSAMLCGICGVFYQLMAQIVRHAGHIGFRPSRNEPLLWDRCAMCGNRDLLIRPPNTTSDHSLSRWVARQLKTIQQNARERGQCVPKEIIKLAVPMSHQRIPHWRGLVVISAPSWHGLAKDDPFRSKGSRILRGGPTLVVPALAHLPQRLNIIRGNGNAGEIK